MILLEKDITWAYFHIKNSSAFSDRLFWLIALGFSWGEPKNLTQLNTEFCFLCTLPFGILSAHTFPAWTFPFKINLLSISQINRDIHEIADSGCFYWKYTSRKVGAPPLPFTTLWVPALICYIQALAPVNADQTSAEPGQWAGRFSAKVFIWFV